MLLKTPRRRQSFQAVLGERRIFAKAARVSHANPPFASSRTRSRHQTNGQQFPIYTDERRFKERSTNQIEGIVGDERTLIERVQPFNAPMVRVTTPSPCSTNSQTATSTAC
jgi:hypothetical protein